MAAIPESVRIRNGVKTGNALWRKAFLTALSATGTAKRDCLQKIKPYGFTLFIKRYGVEELLDCLERNEKNGVVYHREGVFGDYDDFEDVEELIHFIKTGER